MLTLTSRRRNMRGKLFALVSGIVLAGLISFSPADAAQRGVLAELFSSTT
jgi:hypothetical protein